MGEKNKLNNESQIDWPLGQEAQRKKRTFPLCSSNGTGPIIVLVNTEKMEFSSITSAT